ncbi:hypothetical protein NCS52_01208900 [Fusarium sp. LHS14.1]|nr:hypothetical protein NCS52_01208900 [Fusarium sp. LHS14.1]
MSPPGRDKMGVLDGRASLLFHLHPWQERAHQTQHHHILFNLDPITMSNKLPGTTAINSRGEEKSVSIFPMPGTEAEEVPLWQFFEERPVSSHAGTTSLLASSTTSLDDV